MEITLNMSPRGGCSLDVDGLGEKAIDLDSFNRAFKILNCVDNINKLQEKDKVEIMSIYSKGKPISGVIYKKHPPVYKLGDYVVCKMRNKILLGIITKINPDIEGEYLVDCHIPGTDSTYESYTEWVNVKNILPVENLNDYTILL